jgi:pilus assembly protein CpaC
MIRVIGEQQVMLQVQVVEVNRAAARAIGINFGLFRNTGAFVAGGTLGNLGQSSTGFTTFNPGLGGLGASLTGLGRAASRCPRLWADSASHRRPA